MRIYYTDNTGKRQELDCGSEDWENGVKIANSAFDKKPFEIPIRKTWFGDEEVGIEAEP